MLARPLEDRFSQVGERRAPRAAPSSLGAVEPIEGLSQLGHRNLVRVFVERVAADAADLQRAQPRLEEDLHDERGRAAVFDEAEGVVKVDLPLFGHETRRSPIAAGAP